MKKHKKKFKIKASSWCHVTLFFFQQSNRRKPLEPGDISAKEIRDGKTKVVLRSSLLRDCLHFTSIFKEGLIRKRKYKSFFIASPSRKRIEPVLVSRLCFSFFFFFFNNDRYCCRDQVELLHRLHSHHRRLFVLSRRFLRGPAELWERTGWRPPADHPLARGSRER